MDLPIEMRNDSLDDDDDGRLVEIGDRGVWSVSSAKPGYGVLCLRDNSLDTYWQSDGTQPHTVTVEFPRLVNVASLALYLHVEKDESYTPQSISVRVGTCTHDLYELRADETYEPHGWVLIPLGDVCLRMIQVAVLSNHENGRDSHMRLMRIYARRTSPTDALHVPSLATARHQQRYLMLR